MIMRRLATIFTLLLVVVGCAHTTPSSVEVERAGCAITLDWSSGELWWRASYDGREAVAPSRLRMTTSLGEWGEAVAMPRIDYLTTEEYSGAVVAFGDYGVEIRAYDDGVAYRFVSYVEGEYTIVDELSEFAFDGDDRAWVPYVNHRPNATADYATQYETSFENIYSTTTISQINPRRLMFAPILLEHNDLKLWISEANLEDYPGMFLSNGNADGVVDSEFAPVPHEVVQGGHNMLQGIVKSRKPYIAECEGERSFPWRIVAIGNDECDIVNSRLVWQLADESRISDSSWIKPGKVAWEWWNDWRLEGVDFEAGINNATYKYYIDFASRYGIEYVILDEGWSVLGEADLMKVVPEIDIAELVAYGEERGVGIILWAGYWALQSDIEGICRHYAQMGVKGFKVDFLDRDDQEMVRFVYDVARIAAKYELLVDYHGIYKPTGLERTYPNAINFEGVHGLETMKWLGAEHDQITYDVTLPYIRGVAGPVDYTPGAMRNAAKGHYQPNYSYPMSQGTRCHQLAMYVIYNQPLAMLADSPTAYEQDEAFTSFLAQMPTTWEHREASEGVIGEYVAMEAVAHDGTIYYAALNGHTPRSVEVRLPEGERVRHIEIWSDGANAEVDGTDYEHKVLDSEAWHEADGAIDIALASGGGCVCKILIDK